MANKSMITCKINYNELNSRLKKDLKAAERAVNGIIGDFKRRAPGWIAAEAAKAYNIKKTEIRPSGNFGRAPTGNICTRGNKLKNVALVYKGGPLSPVHFGTTPKVPKASYTLKTEILKGQKKTLGKIKKLTKKQRKNIGRNFTHQGKQNSPKSPIMLMSTGAKSGGEDKVKYIPFQRQSQRRNNLEAVKTLSMPQMLTNPKVEKGIESTLSKNISKRMYHYLNR